MLLSDETSTCIYTATLTDLNFIKNKQNGRTEFFSDNSKQRYV